MKTRLFSLTLIFMFATTLAFSQGSNARTSLGLLGGVNLQNFSGKDMEGNKLENDMMIGYHFGINVQLPVAPEFYFEPGLLYSVKGAKSSDGMETYTLSYIELPLNFVYKALLGDGYFMLGFGPYLAYGIGGQDIEFSKELGPGDPHRTFKPFDAGGNLFFGYEMAGGLFLRMNTQLGMMNIYPDDPSDSERIVKNTGYGFSLGYRL